eukprot:363097-Chlamydomonas_euryale.AAC.6
MGLGPNLALACDVCATNAHARVSSPIAVCCSCNLRNCKQLAVQTSMAAQLRMSLAQTPRHVA